MPHRLTPESLDEVRELIYRGRKLAACKRYRELCGKEAHEKASLLEAKEFVDQLTAELQIANPQRFEKEKSTSSGCGAMVAAGAIVCGGLGWLL